MIWTAVLIWKLCVRLLRLWWTASIDNNIPRPNNTTTILFIVPHSIQRKVHTHIAMLHAYTHSYCVLCYTYMLLCYRYACVKSTTTDNEGGWREDELCCVYECVAGICIGVKSKSISIDTFIACGKYIYGRSACSPFPTRPYCTPNNDFVHALRITQERKPI